MKSPVPAESRHETFSEATSMEISDQRKLELYYYMRLARECDNAMLRLYRQGKIVGGAYTGNGNEATAVGSAYALERHDYLFPLHRDLGAHLVKGQSLRNIFLQLLGKAGSLTGGRDGTGHYADPSLKIYGNVSHLGAMIPVGVGVALASKLRKEGAVVLTYIGDGGSNIGDFHEGVNMAAVMRLPFVLIIENNQYAYSTPLSKQFAGHRLSDRAVGYGIPGMTVDGTNVLQVLDACRDAVERARAGGGPSIIETITMRMHGHSASDDASYVPAAMIERWKQNDPLDKFERALLSDGLLDEEAKQRLVTKIAEAIAEAIQFAEASPPPEGPEAADGVYASKSSGGPALQNGKVTE